MKKTILIGMLLIFAQSNIFSQNNSEVIDSLDYEIKKAISNENFTKAAKLKKEKDFIIAIDKAIKEEDYEKAAKLKNEKDLPSAIEKAVEEGDYEKASRLKKKLDDAKNIKPSISKIDSNGKYKTIIMNNGVFINGTFGGSSTQSGAYGNIGFEFGYKWYFGNGKHYRFGLQITIVKASLFVPEIAGSLSLANLGFSNLFEFKENYGLEVNFDTGYSLLLPNSNGTRADDFIHGVTFNPELKYRYKRFAIGVEANFTTYVGRYGGFIAYPALTIGGKF